MCMHVIYFVRILLVSSCSLPPGRKDILSYAVMKHLIQLIFIVVKATAIFYIIQMVSYYFNYYR